MNVSELINHLKNFDQNLEVWYMSDFSNDSFYRLNEKDVQRFMLEDYSKPQGEIEVCMIGDLP